MFEESRIVGLSQENIIDMLFVPVVLGSILISMISIMGFSGEPFEDPNIALFFIGMTLPFLYFFWEIKVKHLS